MIQMHRPGLLIGKGGSFLDKLEKRLEKYYKKKVDIYIEENPLWYL
jgi:ribosomal protein S3